MELIQGRNLWNGALPDYTPDQRREIYHAMVDTLADLHTTDPQKIGLGEYGKPQDYCARQIARWTKQYKLSETDEIPEMDALIAWLPETVPDQHASGIVHGDYRLDNMIFHAEQNSVAAVLDWELSTLGDPIADFSYFVLNWHNPSDGRAGLGGKDLKALGIPSAEEVTQRYVERTGYPVPDMDWYFAFNLFKFAGIIQGIKKRVIDGTASSAHAKKMSERVRPLVQSAYGFAQRAGMD